MPSKLTNVELVDFEVASKVADIHVMLVDHQDFKIKTLISDYLIDTKGIW